MRLLHCLVSSGAISVSPSSDRDLNSSFARVVQPFAPSRRSSVTISQTCLGSASFLLMVFRSNNFDVHLENALRLLDVLLHLVVGRALHSKSSPWTKSHSPAFMPVRVRVRFLFYVWFETKATWLHTHKKASPVLERLCLEKSEVKLVPNQFYIASLLFIRRPKPPSNLRTNLQTPKSIRNTLLIAVVTQVSVQEKGKHH